MNKIFKYIGGAFLLVCVGIAILHIYGRVCEMDKVMAELMNAMKK